MELRSGTTINNLRGVDVNLFQMKQNPDETIENYLARVCQTTNEYEIPKHLLIGMTVQGLKSEVRKKCNASKTWNLRTIKGNCRDCGENGEIEGIIIRKFCRITKAYGRDVNVTEQKNYKKGTAYYNSIFYHICLYVVFSWCKWWFLPENISTWCLNCLHVHNFIIIIVLSV